MEGFQPLQKEDLLPELLGLMIHWDVLEVYLEENDVGGVVVDDLVNDGKIELLL